MELHTFTTYCCVLQEVYIDFLQERVLQLNKLLRKSERPNIVLRLVQNRAWRKLSTCEKSMPESVDAEAT